MKMLRDERVAGLVKLRCSFVPCRQSPVWAECASWTHPNHGPVKSAQLAFMHGAASVAKGGERSFAAPGTDNRTADKGW